MADTFPIEIFAVGKWNGIPITLDDLHDFVANFYKLKAIQQVPLKIGHNEEQPLKASDGQPSLGWVEDLEVRGKKLIAMATDVPKILQKAIKKKLYRKVSIEALFDVEHKGKSYKNVLDAVALLGVDAPAVNTLEDLNAYMSRRDFSLGGKVQIFTYDEGGTIMPDDVKKLSDKIDALTSSFTKLQDEHKTLVTENEALKKENAQFKADKEKAETNKKVLAVTEKRSSITALFDRAIKEEKITPAKRELYSNMLGLDDDDKVEKIDPAHVMAMLDLEEKKADDDDKAKTKGKYQRVHKDAGEELTRLASKKSLEDKMDFSTALNIVMLDHPDLANEHYKMED